MVSAKSNDATPMCTTDRFIRFLRSSVHDAVLAPDSQAQIPSNRVYLQVISAFPPMWAPSHPPTVDSRVRWDGGSRAYVGGNLAIGTEEDFVNVEETNVFSIVEPGDDFIHLADRLKLFRFIRGSISGKDGKQQHFAAWTFLASLFDDQFDPVGDRFRRIAVAVIGADHQ